MESGMINILCSTDDNYAPYCGVMLTSLFENNKNNSVHVFILINHPLHIGYQKMFDRLSNKFCQPIDFVLVDSSYLDNFSIKGVSYLTMTTYYRLYADMLLPRTVKKALYLDCDIIVTDSLKPLWNIDMTDVAIGAVSDVIYLEQEVYEHLKIPFESKYFNAGAILLNLDFWREHHIGQQCLDYLRDNYDRVIANDQDVLNAVLFDKKMDIPITYNYQIQFRKKYYFDQYSESMKTEIMAVNIPIVIHYAAYLKPWSCLYFKIPFKNIWWYYKRKSQWWYLLPQLPNRKVVNYIVKRYLLWPLGIMWKQEYI